MSIEKRSGRMLLSDDNLQNATNFFGVHIDPRAGTIDFLSMREKITHSPAPAKDGKAAAPDSGAAPAPRTATGARSNRSPLDRLPLREVGNPLPPR